MFKDLKRELLSKKYSYRTVKGYLYYNRDFLLFTVKNPSDINDNDIKDYLLYLAEERQSATSTLNQAINALKFYYSIMLKRKFLYEIKRPRKDKKLPVVLSKEEVANILSAVDNVEHRAILMTVYSAGPRVGEVVRLKLEDIDTDRMLIHVKGAKAGRHLSRRTIEKIFDQACDKAGIKKDVSVHDLRHYAELGITDIALLLTCLRPEQTFITYSCFWDINHLGRQLSISM